MDKSKLLLIVVVAFFGISFLSNIYQSCQEPKVLRVKESIDTTKLKQQFKAELEAELRAELKPIIKTKIQKVPSTINLDSLRQAIDEYWLAKIQAMNQDVPVKPSILNQYDYYAIGKFAITDSVDKGDTIAKGNVKYLSRIPLDPEAKFTFYGTWYSRQITHTTETTIEEKKSFFQRFFGGFNYSIHAGFGEGLINKQFDFYVGFGISYNIGSVF